MDTLRPRHCSSLGPFLLLLQILVGASHAMIVVEAAADLGPIRLWPGRNAFSWQASLNATTGLATSMEVTTQLPRQHPWSKPQSQQPSDFLDRCSRYPEWLVRGPVTFGLFRAAPAQDGGRSLQDRFFGGHDFLIFGKPITRRRQAGEWTVELPIQGGVLSLKNPNKNKQRGCLRYTLRRQSPNDVTSTTTTLITEIRGYTPWIAAASTTPVPLYRKWTYLSTQSLVHAYVMWRFHRYCCHSTKILPPTR